MAENAVIDQLQQNVGAGLGAALPFAVGQESQPGVQGAGVGKAIVDAAKMLAQWDRERRDRAVDASRQTPEERRMSRGADEKGLAAFGQAAATTPDTVSWHPLARAAAMLSEFDPGYPGIERAMSKYTGIPPIDTGMAPPQPLGQAYLHGKDEAEKLRTQQMADMPSLPPAREMMMRMAGVRGVSTKQPPLTKTVATGAYNAAEDLGNVVTAIPGLVAQTVLPRLKMPGETDEQAAARAIEEGRAMGRGVKQSVLGGTADIVEHPLESAATKPFTTALTMGGPMRASADLGKAGLMEAGVPAKAFETPAKAESPVLNQALQNLRDGLMKNSAPLGDMVNSELSTNGGKVGGAIGRAAGTAVSKGGMAVGALIDQYLAKFADGFYSGDPRVTVMAEEFARDKEKAMASAKAAIGRMAGGAAKELERTPVEGPLPGLPGQGPAPIAPDAPPAPPLTMPPKAKGASAPAPMAGTPPPPPPPAASASPAPPAAAPPGFLDEADLAMTKKARASTAQRLADLEAAQEMPEPARPTGRFHGTSAPLDRLDEGHYDPRNIYGQGFYTTDSHEIAQGYSKKDRNGAPTIYTVESKDVPLFDMERPMDAETRQMVDASIDQFGMLYRSAADNLPKNASLLDAYNHIRRESTEAGLSKDTVQEIFEGFRGALEGRGFSGLTHVGGKLTGKAPHNVTIFWNPEDVTLRHDDWLPKSAEAKAHNERLIGARERLKAQLKQIDDTLAAHEEAAKGVPPVANPNQIGPQAPLLDRATHVLRESLKGMPEADEFISEFMRNFNEGHPRAQVMADALANDPALAQSVLNKFKTVKNFAEAILKSMNERAGGGAPPQAPDAPPVPGVPAETKLRPVREQTQSQGLYGAQGYSPDEPVRVPTDTAAAERVARLGPGVSNIVPEVVDEFMRHGKVDEAKRPALTQMTLLALQDAIGGEGKTATWRGQMHGNPEQFAKDLIAAAEAKTGTSFTRKVKAQILDTLDKRDKKGLPLVSIVEHPEGGFEVVRTTRLPSQSARGGKVVELNPEELVPPRRLSPDEVRASVQSQLEETLKDHLAGTEISAHVKSEGARALSETAHGPVPPEVLDVARDLFDKTVVDELVSGATDREQAVRQVAQVAHNIMESRRKGDVIPQILPVGMKATDAARLIREIGRRGLGEEVVPVAAEARAPGAAEVPPERTLPGGAPEELPAPEMPALESEPVAPLAKPVQGELANPIEQPVAGIVDTTAERAPPRRMTKQEARQLHDLAWEVQGYRPLHRAKENIGLGTKTEPIYGNVLLGDALKWHKLSEDALKDTGALGLLDKWFKSNNTNKSLASGVNNFIPNISNVGMQYGVDPVTMLSNGVQTLQDLADWHGKDAGHVSADNARAFKNLDKAGVGMDFVQHQLGDHAMSPSEVLRTDPFFGWLRNPGTDLPHTRAAKWFYRFGDQVIRIQEGVQQFKRAAQDIAGLKDGEFYDLAPTKRQQVRVTREGDQYYVQNPYALEAKDRAPTPVTADQLDQLIGKHAAHRSTLIVQDYPDIPQYPKALTTSKWLRALSSPFRSYAGGAIDMPGKAGLVTNTMARSPFAVSTNSKTALARAGAQELKATLGRAMIVNGVRAQLVKQGANGPVANMFRSRPDDDQRVIMGNLMSPRAIEGLRMGQWANIGPTADFVGMLAALAAQPESAREHGLAAQGKLTTFGKEVVAADTGKDFNGARALRLAMMSGGPIANMWDGVLQDAKAGRPVNLEKLTTTMANSLIGGTNAALARSASGYLADTGPDKHLRMPVGEAREAAAEMSGRKRTTESMTGSPETPAYAMPLIMYFAQQVIGKAFQAQDVNSMDPKQVKSILHEMGLAMKQGAGIKSEEAVQKQAQEDIAHAQPGERKDQAKLENAQGRAQELTRKTIDQTVERLWNEYQKTYRMLHGPFRPRRK